MFLPPGICLIMFGTSASVGKCQKHTFPFWSASNTWSPPEYSVTLFSSPHVIFFKVFWFSASCSSTGSMGLRLRYHSALPQPAAVEEEGEQQVDLAGPRALQEVWLFPSASITWLPVTSTSPTTSFAATNTGRPRRGWPLTAKVGTELKNNMTAWIFFFCRCQCWS